MSTYDTVIRGGTVVDGMRLPRYRADVGLRGGRIAKIGRIAEGEGERELDATGMIVAPGFVDLHTHYDAQVHWDPYCTISGWHGVTSVVLGNCGFGFAPCKPEGRERSMMMMTRTEQIPYESMKAGMPWRWETFPEWLDNLEKIPKGVNLLSYVPVSPLMVYVMGMDAAKSRAATPAEQREMQRLLHEAMDAGACGFSIQRLGPHSFQADFDGTPMPTDTMVDEDILILADVLRERDEGFIQITQATGGDASRSGDAIQLGDREFIEHLAERAGRPLIHNAIGAIEGHPDVHRRELEWVRSCNERGLRIIAQGVTVRTWFQFTLEHWNLYDFSPAWNEATQGSAAERMVTLSDPAMRVRLREEEPMLVAIGEGTCPAALVITGTPGHPELEKYIGRKIGDIAADEDKHVVDTMLDIAVAGELAVEFRGGDATSADPKMVGELIRDPHVIAGVSDGGAHTKFFTGGSYTTDVLTWLVRDTQELSLEEAHYHLSFLPAQSGGFFDRGFLREGAPADIIVYDLANLKRTPEWDYEIAHDFPADEWRRVQRADGYRWTIVNGEITFEDGRCTGATPGQLLRNQKLGDVALSAVAG